MLTSISVTFFVILRYLGVGNILNLIFILALTITAEIFLSKN